MAEGNRSINSKISILFWKGNKEHSSLFLGLHISLMPKFASTNGRFWLCSNKPVLASVD